MPKDTGALIHSGDNDYILKDDQTSVWITVNDLSVYVLRDGEGVQVRIYPINKEMDNELASCEAQPE